MLFELFFSVFLIYFSSSLKYCFSWFNLCYLLQLVKIILHFYYKYLSTLESFYFISV